MSVKREENQKEWTQLVVQAWADAKRLEGGMS